MSETTTAVPKSAETHRARRPQQPTRLNENREKKEDRKEVDARTASAVLVGQWPWVPKYVLTLIIAPKAEGSERKKGQFLSSESLSAVAGER